MEPTKYYKVKATLELVCPADLLGAHGKLLEHRTFFVADRYSKNLKETWTINDTSTYEHKMLLIAIHHKILFRLSSLHTGLHFHFWLIIREAEPFDCFYMPGKLKVNTTYYVSNEHNIITGPLYISEFDNPNHIMQLLELKKILVPTKKQLFEEIKNQQSA